jgi:hypothetical protein
MLHQFRKALGNLMHDSNYMSQQTSATKALIKFCEDHGYVSAYVDTLRKCLVALEEKDLATAVSHFRNVPLGRMGCFDDWWPKAAGNHETDEYACAVFEALTERWFRLMNLSAKDTRKK